MTPETIAAAIRACAQQADAASWSAALFADMTSSGIVTAKRLAMFIGQVSVESQGFTRLSEDMTYTHPTALRSVWPDKFPIGFDPTPYLNNPEHLADYVYGDRADLGNTEPGDGWRFRGAGLIQLTGRWWFSQFGAAVGMTAEAAVDWARTPEGAARSACWYWTRKGINRAADNWVVTDATLAINPALRGIDARITACNRALAALAGAGFVGVVAAAPEPQISADHSAETASQAATPSDTTDALNAAELAKVQS